MNAKSLKWAAVLSLSVWTLAPSLHGQEKSAEQPPAKENTPFKFSVGANLVLVPVVVTDKHRRHVTGLTSGNFEVLEDGKLQEIAAFEEVTAETTVAQRPAPAANSFTNQVIVAQPKKLEIILLDLLNTPLSGRAEARRGLIEFLSQSAHANSLLALLVLRSDGVSMVHNFTSDPAVLQEAIRKVRSPVVSRDSPTLNTNGGDADAEARQLKAILAGQAAIAAMGSTPSPGAGIAAIRGLEATMDVSRQNQEAYLTQQCLIQIARYFAGVPGRKSLLWASTGFRFQPPVLGAAQSETPDLWRNALRMLQDANIAVYPVDVGGINLGPQGDVADHGFIPSLAPGADLMRPGGLADPNRGKHSVMDTLAHATGGLAYFNLNDSSELFGRASEDSGQYYMLAYYTKADAKDGWRKLHVRVLSEGVQVRARSGFFFNNAVHDSEATRQADEIMALASALESTSLPIHGQWKQVEAAGDQRKVHFALAIPPGVVLVDTEHENHINLDFLVLAWNADGKEAARIGQRLENKLSPGDLTQVQAEGISYANVLTLPPGEYDVHIVVRDNLKGSLGSVVTRLTVE